MGAVRGEHSEYLLTGVLVCTTCGGNFVGQPGAKRKNGTRPYRYGCGYNAWRGNDVCDIPPTLAPSEGEEQGATAHASRAPGEGIEPSSSRHHEKEDDSLAIIEPWL